MSILNARLLGPEGVGVLVLLHLLRTLSVRITDFGFGRALRFYSANGKIPYLSLRKIVMQLGTFMAIGVVLSTFILKNLPINVWNDIDTTVYLLFLPTPFFFVLTVYLRHLLHGQLLITAVNISEVLERVLYILIFALLVWYLDLGLIGVSLALSISSFFLFIQLFVRAYKYETSPLQDRMQFNRLMLIKKLWNYGQWSYYFQFIEYLISNFPILFLKSSVGAFSQIGFFSKAKGLAEYPKTPAVQISGLLFSFNAGAKQVTANYRTETMCRLSLWVTTIFFVTLSLVIRPLISLLYGDAFLPAANIFYYLYPSIVFYIQELYLNSALAASGYNKETFTIRLKALPIVLIAAYFLIIYMGIIGAAISVSFSATILWFQSARKYCALLDSNFRKILLLQKQDVDLIKMLFGRFLDRIKSKNKV